MKILLILPRFPYPLEKGDKLRAYHQIKELSVNHDIALFALGSMVRAAEEVRKELKDKGYPCSLINARFAKPVDEDVIREMCIGHSLIVTFAAVKVHLCGN